jgi:hypothetical protein
VKESNRPGYITYAQRGTDTRATQLFLDHLPLDAQGFAPFGKVSQGMDVEREPLRRYGGAAQQNIDPA